MRSLLSRLAITGFILTSACGEPAEPSPVVVDSFALVTLGGVSLPAPYWTGHETELVAADTLLFLAPRSADSDPTMLHRRTYVSTTGVRRSEEFKLSYRQQHDSLAFPLPPCNDTVGAPASCFFARRKGQLNADQLVIEFIDAAATMYVTERYQRLRRP